jgi:hypothetical protein
VRRWLPRVPLSFLVTLVTTLIVLPCRFGANAAELEGVQLPNTVQMNGKTLYLNGFGRRTYPILGIHIYIAGLYLEHLSTNPDEIIQSPEVKLLTVRFERSVSADDARNAWRKNLERGCTAPCRLDPEDVERFLSQVPAMRAGDIFHLLFTRNAVTVTVNGQQIGTISRQQFAEAMLGSFLGPNTDLPDLRQALLTGRVMTVTQSFASQSRSDGRQ